MVFPVENVPCMLWSRVKDRRRDTSQRSAQNGSYLTFLWITIVSF